MASTEDLYAILKMFNHRSVGLNEYLDDIVDQTIKEITEDIEFQKRVEELCNSGWKKFNIEKSVESDEIIKDWCENTCQGKVIGRKALWAFEKEQDLAVFILKWA